MSEYTKIIYDLNEIKIAIAEIKQELKHKNDKCIKEDDRITNIEKILNGNGRIGLKSQVYILWGVFSALCFLFLDYFKRG